jgi:ribosomal-protein-alanine N-acetyltransferase
MPTLTQNPERGLPAEARRAPGGKEAVLRILPAAAADVPAMMGLQKRSDISPWADSSYLSELGERFSHSRCLWLGDKIVGLSVFRIFAGEAHLLRLMISPDLQGIGLGRKMMSDFFDEARAIGVERLFLEVSRDNVKAIGLYRRFGFEVVGISRNYYGGGVDALAMSRVLRPMAGPAAPGPVQASPQRSQESPK